MLLRNKINFKPFTFSLQISLLLYEENPESPHQIYANFIIYLF
jgi:hypothetical protein